MLGLLIPVVALVGIVLVVFSVLLLRRAEEDPLANRIEEYASREEIMSIEDIELEMRFTDRVLVPIIRRLSDYVVRLTPQSALERTAKQLEMAGSPRNLSAAEFYAIGGVTMILLGGLFFLVMVRAGNPLFQQIGAALLAGLFGFFLPHLLLRARIDRRKQAIIKKLPDALDLMTICVDAGLVFDGAMAKVHEKWDDPLAEEFGRVIQEMQLGKSRRQALRDMTDRMDVPDVRSFVGAILQAEQLGVGIAKILRIQSEQMRIRRRQRAEEKAHQAAIKMLFPMIFLIFPAMFVVLLGPAGLRVVRSNALRSLG